MDADDRKQKEEIAEKIARQVVDQIRDNDLGYGSVVLTAIKMVDEAFREGKDAPPAPGVRIGCLVYMAHSVLDHDGSAYGCKICQTIETLLWTVIPKKKDGENEGPRNRLN